MPPHGKESASTLQSVFDIPHFEERIYLLDGRRACGTISPSKPISITLCITVENVWDDAGHRDDADEIQRGSDDV